MYACIVFIEECQTVRELSDWYMLVLHNIYSSKFVDPHQDFIKHFDILCSELVIILGMNSSILGSVLIGYMLNFWSLDCAISPSIFF